jgi:uncharacterized membrane protein
MMPAIVTALYAAVIVFDFRRHVMKKPKGEKALYLMLMAVSFSVMMLYALGVTVPSPAKPIGQAVEALFHVQ